MFPNYLIYKIPRFPLIFPRPWFVHHHFPQISQAFLPELEDQRVAALVTVPQGSLRRGKVILIIMYSNIWMKYIYIYIHTSIHKYTVCIIYGFICITYSILWSYSTYIYIYIHMHICTTYTYIA